MKTTILTLSFLLLVWLQGVSQNLGIGVADPQLGKLEVKGTGIGNTVAIFGGDVNGISIQRGNPSIGFNQYFDGTNSRYIANGYAAVQWLNTANGNMYIDLFGNGFKDLAASGYTTSITVSNNGSVGIGSPILPQARVTVARGTGVNGTALFRGSTYPSHINYSTAENTYIRGGKAGSIVYLNDVNGTEVYFGNPTATTTSLVKVGINSTNPTYTLEVKGANNLGMILVNSSFYNWQLRTGPALAPGSYQLLYYGEGGNPVGSWHPQTGAYAALSDERLKTDIKPLPDVGKKLNQLSPVQYLMDIPASNQEEKQAGFIAQDMMQVFPDLIKHDNAEVPGSSIPDMRFMNYDGMAVYAIKIIQEQQAQIDALKKRINTLKQKSANQLP